MKFKHPRKQFDKQQMRVYCLNIVDELIFLQIRILYTLATEQ